MQSDLKHRLTVLLDKLDEINFSQDLMREEFSQRLENLDETTMARLGMHQRSIKTFRIGCMSLRLIRRY